MAATVTCTKVAKAAGRGYVRFNDGTELEFVSIAEARAWAEAQLNDVSVKAVLRAVLIVKWLRADPNANNSALIEGRSATADLTSSNVITVA